MFGCFTGQPLKSIFSCFCTRPAFLIDHLFSCPWAFVESLSQLKTRWNSRSDFESKTKSSIYFFGAFWSLWKCIRLHTNFSSWFISPSFSTILFLQISTAQSPILFSTLFSLMFSCSLIRCKLIAPHMGDGTRLVSILIMVCGLAAGNTLPICSRRICQMIGVYTPHPLRSVCHNATSYISITHRIPRRTSPKMHTDTLVISIEYSLTC